MHCSFLPVWNAFQTTVKESRVQEQPSGWRKQTNNSAHWAKGSPFLQYQTFPHGITSAFVGILYSVQLLKIANYPGSSSLDQRASQPTLHLWILAPDVGGSKELPPQPLAKSGLSILELQYYLLIPDSIH